MPDGRGWHPDAMTRAFARLVKRSGLPRIRPHDLRHTHATHLLAAGTNVRVTSERLGTRRSRSPSTSTATCSPATKPTPQRRSHREHRRMPDSGFRPYRHARRRRRPPEEQLATHTQRAGRFSEIA
jgi:hypothetical protein